MRLGFANTQRLALGVRLPTDCGLVLPRWALGPQIMAWRCVGERLGYHLCPVGASERLPNQHRRQLPSSAAVSPSFTFPDS